MVIQYMIRVQDKFEKWTAPKLVKMCVTLQHYMLNLACHDSVNGNEVRFFFYAADNRYSKYHDRLRFLPVGSTRRARDHNPVISGLFSSSVVYSEVIFRSVKILGM